MYKQFQKQRKSMLGIVIFNMVIKLAFWLGLGFGSLWILKYFNII